jgi:hypothetical protein
VFTMHTGFFERLAVRVHHPRAAFSKENPTCS